MAPATGQAVALDTRIQVRFQTVIRLCPRTQPPTSLHLDHGQRAMIDCMNLVDERGDGVRNDDSNFSVSVRVAILHAQICLDMCI